MRCGFAARRGPVAKAGPAARQRLRSTARAAPAANAGLAARPGPVAKAGSAARQRLRKAQTNIISTLSRFVPYNLKILYIAL